MGTPDAQDRWGQPSRPPRKAHSEARMRSVPRLPPADSEKLLGESGRGWAAGRWRGGPGRPLPCPGLVALTPSLKIPQASVSHLLQWGDGTPGLSMGEADHMVPVQRPRGLSRGQDHRGACGEEGETTGASARRQASAEEGPPPPAPLPRPHSQM